MYSTGPGQRLRYSAIVRRLDHPAPRLLLAHRVRPAAGYTSFDDAESVDHDYDDSADVLGHVNAVARLVGWLAPVDRRGKLGDS
eukprot:scaffold72110_cov24-Prasinocladus_malaysianus.AAC.1